MRTDQGCAMNKPSERKLSDVVNLYLLTECDMHCSFCYASKGLGSLSLTQIRFVLDFLASVKAERISVTGGEPLLHENISEALEYASELGLKVTLFTSGSLLNTRRLRDYSPFLNWLALSLDGDRETNIKVGRSEGHFDAVINVLSQVRQIAPTLQVRVATVVTKPNIGQMPSLAAILSDSRVRPDLWRIKQMLPSRRAGRHAKQLAISEEEFVARMQQIRDICPKEMNVQIHPGRAKSGDMICIHPTGECTTTICADGVSTEIVSLGNIFVEPDLVLTQWERNRDPRNADDYSALWDGRRWPA